MKILRVYSDKSFKNILFADGFNVILAEIHDKTKTTTDTHNLGKTTLIALIDFLLLKGISNKETFFLTAGTFKGYSFFCELKLNNGSFLVIKRSIDNPSKISFKHNKVALSDFSTVLEWDQIDLPFDKAQKHLEERAGFTVLNAWGYRKAISYFLRSQNDYQDVFKLDKFKGKDADWKPFMFELLGFNGSIVTEKYQSEEEREKLKIQISLISKQASININDKDELTGLLDLRRREKNELEYHIDQFNFFERDKEINRSIIEDLDFQIQQLNTLRYALSVDIAKTEKSMQAQTPTIDMNKLKNLFDEVDLHLPDKVVENYESLLAFNKAIGIERKKYLEENLIKLRSEFTKVDQDLQKIENDKAAQLSYLLDYDSYKKFKENQKQLSQIESEMALLSERLKTVDATRELKAKVDERIKAIESLKNQISMEIEKQSHSEIRATYNNIIKQILNTNALISIKQNADGNVEFAARVQKRSTQMLTEEDRGNSYRKLLCIAFDIALLINYSKESFYRFAYHDGALEALDDRKKILFLDFVRKMCKEYKIQYIISTIDSDIPRDVAGNIIPFAEEEICLRLHDKDDSGKLFERSF